MYIKGRGIVIRMPSAVALNKEDGEVVAFGGEARRMFGRTPPEIEVYRPIHDSAVAEFEASARLTAEFFRKTGVISFFNRPSVISTAPDSVTDVQRLALENAILEAGAGSVSVIDTAIAAAVGARLNVRGPRGCMIVDIGGGTVNAAVISSGNIVRGRTLRAGGERMDAAIRNHIRSSRNIMISDAAAEALKLKFSSAVPEMRSTEQVYISGINTRTGLASTAVVGGDDICNSIKGMLEGIVRLIISVVDETPPEIAGDIYDFGMILTGGGANIPGIDKYISQRTGLRVKISETPQDAVCMGLAKIIDNPKILGVYPTYRRR